MTGMLNSEQATGHWRIRGLGTPDTLGRLGVRTDTQGMAFVFFDPKDSSGSPRVTAHLLDLGADDMLDGSDAE